MLWIIFALGAALAWGLYGPALHRGQVALGNPMRALLCVGVAYFLIGVLVPVANLSYSGQLQGFTWKGASAATLGGALGAIGAVCIIFAFKSGGLPTYVMPLVFAWRSAGQRVVLDVVASTQDGPEPFAVCRFCFGCRRGRYGFIFQTAVVRPNAFAGWITIKPLECGGLTPLC